MRQNRSTLCGTTFFRRPHFFIIILFISFATFLSIAVRNELHATGSESGDNEPWAISYLRKTESFPRNKVFCYSIIKILKNYYVDNSRVENSQIVLMAASGVDNLPGFHAEFDQDILLVTSSTGSKMHRLLPSVIEDDILIDTILEIATFIDLEQKRVNLNSFYRLENRSGLEILLNTMLESLDPHSALLTAQDFLELKQGTEGAFGGLGILVSIRDKLLTVIKPLTGSPALRSGIVAKDQIISINDQKTFGKSLDQLIDHMRGEPGSKVSLLIQSPDKPFPKRLDLTREIIQVDSVEIKKNPDKDVLYIYVDTFSAKTSQEVYTAILNFKKNNNGYLKGLILDLRSNPGGLLDQAIQVADLFIEDGPIVSTKGRVEEVESAEKNSDLLDFPIAVLMNSESASASEIVAGALQDHQRAVIIGQPSFGKGSVQTIFELPEKRALKITIARYYTPLGRSIQSKGIIPDIWLQPIYKNKENLNLLGKNHYINESYLRNSLKGVDYYNPKNLPELPVFKGYYLKDSSENVTTDSELAETETDYEVDTALKIFSRLHKNYSRQIPTVTNKSTHWLALAAKEISQAMAKLNGESSDWLRSNLGVDWQSQEKKRPDDVNFQIELTYQNGNLVVPQGKDILADIKIKNLSKKAIFRSSLFVSSEFPGLVPSEILLGSFAPGETKLIKAPINGPSEISDLSFKVNAIISLDSEPLHEFSNETKVFISKRIYADIATQERIESEKGGKITGTIEPGEKAELAVEINNTSKVKLSHLKVKIVNLSGKQSHFGADELVVPLINPASKETLYFPFTAGNKILERNLEYGLIIEAEDLEKPYTASVTLKSLPGQVQQTETSKNLSH